MEEGKQPILRQVLECNLSDDTTNAKKDETSLASHRQFLRNHYELKNSHEKRKREPIRFTEAFSEFQRAIAEASQWVWPEVSAQVDRIRNFAASLEPHYKECEEAACKQRERKLKQLERKREPWKDPWWSLRRHILNDIPVRVRGPFMTACSACGKYYWPEDKEEHLANGCHPPGVHPLHPKIEPIP